MRTDAKRSGPQERRLVASKNEQDVHTTVTQRGLPRRRTSLRQIPKRNGHPIQAPNTPIQW